MLTRVDLNFFNFSLSTLFEEDEPFSSLPEDISLDNKHIFNLAVFYMLVGFYLFYRFYSQPLINQKKLEMLKLLDSPELEGCICIVCAGILTDPVCLENVPMQIYCRACLLQMSIDPWSRGPLHLESIVSLPDIERKINEVIRKAEESYNNLSFLKTFLYRYKKSPATFFSYSLLFFTPIAISSGYTTIHYLCLKSLYKDILPIPIVSKDYPNDLCPVLGLSDIEAILSEGSIIPHSFREGQYAICTSLSVKASFIPYAGAEEIRVIKFLFKNFNYHNMTQESDLSKQVELLESEFTKDNHNQIIGHLSSNHYYCQYSKPESRLQLIAFYNPVLEKNFGFDQFKTLCPLLDPVCPSLTVEDALIIANGAAYFTNPNYTLAREVRYNLQSLEATANPKDTFYRSCAIASHGKMGFRVNGMLASNEQEAKNRAVERIKNTSIGKVTFFRSALSSSSECSYPLDNKSWKKHVAFKSVYEEFRISGYKPSMFRRFGNITCPTLNKELSYEKSHLSLT